MIPVPIEGPARTFFSPTARSWIQEWLECSEASVASRQAAVRESYEKARFNNLQNLRLKQKEANGILDKRTIQVALVKCQPRQRMWGVSGKVVLGQYVAIRPDDMLSAKKRTWQVKGWTHIQSVLPVKRATYMCSVSLPFDKNLVTRVERLGISVSTVSQSAMNQL
jgi:hypothetical protein